LTNIARDVLEDAALDRVYLPLLWLDEAGIPEGQLTQGKYRPALSRVVAQLLSLAGGFYASGNEGLKFLPFRAACAVAVASQVYSRIGKLVVRRGSRAWDKRAVVSPAGKLLAILGGLLLVGRTIPFRIFRKHRPVSITKVWRHQWMVPEVS
jgi:phytoene synthase